MLRVPASPFTADDEIRVRIPAVTYSADVLVDELLVDLGAGSFRSGRNSGLAGLARD
jgi:hypothetical protein